MRKMSFKLPTKVIPEDWVGKRPLTILLVISICQKEMYYLF